MRKISATLAVAAMVCMAATTVSAQARYDSGTRMLHIPSMVLDGRQTFWNVWVRITDYGTVTVRDLGTGTTHAQYDAAQQQLHIPNLLIDHVYPFERVTLERPGFELVRAHDVPFDSGEGGQHTLVVELDLGEEPNCGPQPCPIFILTHVNKPATEQEFCSNNKLQELLTKDPDGTPISFTQLRNACSFDGSRGFRETLVQYSPSFPSTYRYRFTYTP
ncbi:MAG: hypothetical protein KKH21_00630 [Gammaproteobacteria bacterium]|nr:hypothetical protein [Gammaproteobacteria bacterium]